MLTMKGKYGIKAMISLARLYPEDWAQSSALAESNGIPKKFLDAILSELRVAGFIETRKGRSGGYRLLRAAGEITIADILRVIDGPIAPLQCVSKTAYQKCNDCRTQETCEIRLLMLEVRDKMLSVLEHRSLSDLVASGGIARRIYETMRLESEPMPQA